MKNVIRKFLACLFITLPCAAFAQTSPIVWKGIVPLPTGTYLCEGFFTFQKMVDERLGGRLKIEYIGGTEIAQPDKQFDTLRNGIVDVILGTAPQYAHTIPEALALTYNSDMTPMEQRASGFYDLLRKIHLDKANVIYLATIAGGPGEGYRLYTRSRMDNPNFAGKKLRVSENYIAFIRKLNGTPVLMAPADAYSGLERGIVDGLGWPYGTLIDMHFSEVTKYVIDHPFYTHNMDILVNLDSWKKLPDDLRKDLEALAVDLEARSLAETNDAIKEENDKLRAAGLQFVTFSPGDADTYLKAAYDAGWADFIAKNPEYGPRLKELTTKKK
jgi:TRAP-type C4-dicarboxylate transport system substrate-binding protein